MAAHTRYQDQRGRLKHGWVLFTHSYMQLAHSRQAVSLGLIMLPGTTGNTAQAAGSAALQHVR